MSGGARPILSRLNERMKISEAVLDSGLPPGKLVSLLADCGLLNFCLKALSGGPGGRFPTAQGWARRAQARGKFHERPHSYLLFRRILFKPGRDTLFTQQLVLYGSPVWYTPVLPLLLQFGNSQIQCLIYGFFMRERSFLRYFSQTGIH